MFERDVNHVIVHCGAEKSGKTFTLIGELDSNSKNGLLLRTIKRLLSEKCKLLFHCYEVYNQQVIDLCKLYILMAYFFSG